MIKKVVAGAAALLTSAALTIGGVSMADASTHYAPSDYGNNPHANNNVHPSWGDAAWPNCPTDIENVGYSDLNAVSVRTDLVPLVKALLEKTEAMGYDLKPDATWGFNCRSIRGSNAPSNHSRGLAVDLNSDENPMGSEFVSTIPPEVVHMWESAGFYWGGRYSSRPDAMHFEYIGSKEDVARYTDQVKGSGGDSAPTTPPSDGTPPSDSAPADAWCHEGPAPTIHRGSTGGPVKDAQCLLNKKGYDAGEIDGIFGQQTDDAVRRFQRDAGLEADGYVGPKTWEALGHDL